MDKKIADKWVKALRSGKYKQGQGKLKEKDKYCCLGVLCEVQGIDQRVNGSSNITRFGENSTATIQADIREKCGIKTQLGSIYDGVTLASLNDEGAPTLKYGKNTEPLTFDEIADIIQICYKEL